MRKLRFILLLLVLSTSLHAAHIAGGELQYKYVGPGADGNSDVYLITMRLFRECNSTGPQLASEIVNVGVYINPSLTLVQSVTLQLQGGVNSISITPNSVSCIIGNPEVCYQVAIYSNSITLPRSATGYTLTWARCCRANGLANTTGGQIGATYLAKIPGTAVLPSGYNSSPEFVVKDTALVCAARDFLLDFSASDPDGDSLSYAFCEAYLGGSTGNQNAPPSGTFTLSPVAYAPPYNGGEPLGSTVTINPVTGVITGVAPAAFGRYVVNVCVTEWRNGVPISEHRKDFILKVGDCDFIAATLKPEYIMCNSYTSAFLNESASSGIHSYYWDFGVNPNTDDTSNLPVPTFTYPDTGVYVLTLIINRNEECSDTATSMVRVFPGFTPGFNFHGSCFQTPFQFTDATTAAYGVVNKWKWDFGETEMSSDTSIIRNPTYQYPNPGTRNVQLIVSSSKGCRDTITKAVNVLDKPFLQLPFKDTLICSIDTLPLIAHGSGIFTWTPNYNISNTNTANPYVFPKDTTKYIVTLNESGCIASDTITVNVLDFITVNVGPDTAICSRDSILINTASHALNYQWTPNFAISDASAKHPKVAPCCPTTYFVNANLGKCQAKDTIKIRVSPYPVANAGRDTAICYGERAFLHGSVTSTNFAWFPLSSLMNGNTLSPVAGPMATTAYILKATGNGECPKSVFDTVNVVVYPQVKAFAGNDTTVTEDEPLQLNAKGGATYSWSPAFYINDPGVASPIITLNKEIDSMIYRVRVTTAEGCFADDDIKIVVFKTGPEVFVPTGFTPNRDRKNDILRPIPVGIKQLEFFRVFNRYGQMIYQTSDIGKGWDGTVNGIEQPSGTYVFMIQAINYKNERIFKKGTVVLIR